MITVYDTYVSNQEVSDNLSKLCNSIFKLLPMKEEGTDWEKPLETIVIEVLGMKELFPDLSYLLTLACKLEGLYAAREEIEFPLYRRTIFECCSLVSKAREQCQDKH
jgi:hypothetical protein